MLKSAELAQRRFAIPTRRTFDLILLVAVGVLVASSITRWTTNAPAALLGGH